ncbi:START domain-containing protein [Flavobacteriaceae bacterium]|nr:START domain-containing protein [Flavobacteriaceae bacterium]
MRLILMFFLLSNLTLFGQNIEGWELKRDSKNIRIYTREIPDSDIKEYRAQMLVNAPVQRIVDYVLDYDLMMQWNKTVVDYKVLEQKDDGDIVYMENSAPWPVENRDNISLVSLEYLPDGSARIFLEGVSEDLVPQKKGVVRMKNVKGYWEIRPFKDKTMVVQQMYGDPEGSIPSSFVNGFMASSAHKTFKALREICESNSANH